MTCLFAVTWSVGATCDADGRVKFDEFLQRYACDQTTSNHPHAANSEVCLQPPGGSIYDYFICYEDEGTWKSWKSLNPAAEVPSMGSEKNLQRLIIPTADTARASFFLNLAISYTRPMLFVGPTGTGKSAYIKDKLLNSLPAANECSTVLVNFSARTSVSLAQSVIEARLGKRGKNILGPPAGHKCLAFIDDLNMPAKDMYGSQPPIELLRQYLDYGYW